MSPPTSSLYRLEDIPSAGRGLLASKPLSADLLVLTSPQPAAHVIFRHYRKEVCAKCFLYDRGRTLPVRDSNTSKVFCSQTCRGSWEEEQGGLGVAAWQGLDKFVKSRSKAVDDSEVSAGPKPDTLEIEAAWERAEEIAQLQRSGRCSSTSQPNQKPKTDKAYRAALHRIHTQAIDPDVLGYLLSGILFYQQHRDLWESHVCTLARDTRPYKSSEDLGAHCNSFMQLSAIVPLDLLPSCTTEVVRILADASSHNAFGIRSGSDDNEEYMGYSLYPSASYFNHSCGPSIKKKRTGRCWEFRTIGDIDIDQELCISYLGGDEKDLTVVERRGRLKETWGFECMCHRCKEESAGA